MPGSISFSHQALLRRMGYILKSATEDPTFSATSMTTGFKEWVKKSDFTQEEKEIIKNTTTDILFRLERRLRLVREELNEELFNKIGGTNGNGKR